MIFSKISFKLQDLSSVLPHPPLLPSLRLSLPLLLFLIVIITVVVIVVVILNSLLLRNLGYTFLELNPLDKFLDLTYYHLPSCIFLL